MAGIADYLNRTIDYLAFQGGGTSPDPVELIQELVTADNPGLVVTGIEKLAQRFLLLLLTERGSMRYLPQSGTQFLTQARMGTWRTSLDVQQSFASALLDITRQLGGSALSTDPPDEVFAGAALLGITLNGDSVSLTLSLTSQAGSSRTLIVPLSLMP